MVVGGILQQNNNYDAASTVFLLHVGTEPPASAASRQPLWLWLVLASLLFAAVIAACMLLRRHRKSTPGAEEEAQPTDSDAATGDKALMERITRYMDEQQPYLSSELKVQDVADALKTNRTYLSNCIRSQRGCSFSQLVNAYRVEYAQQLLRRHPDKKISEVWMASGFSTESSFFRTFKAITGMAPKEWMAIQ
jgi:AraC-like DNA-binding protein